MATKANKQILTGAVAAAIALLLSAPAVADIDAVAAKKLARKDHCLRCHAVEKKKEGPAYHAIAYKYKGQVDAQEKLVRHITSGEKVKLSDGHEENHKVSNARDEAQVNNLIGWILAQ